MSDVEVAACAGNVAAAVYAENRICQLSMARLASSFCYTPVVAGDLDVVRISACSKCKGMKEPVSRFRNVFTRQIMRCVAIITVRDCVVAAVNPTVVVVLHYVAIGAGFRIVG